MSNQDQRVAAGGTAIQAARDVVISQGLSTQQIAEIITALSNQLSAGAAEAAIKFEQRLDKFKIDILNEVAAGRVESSAFNDPDFQFVVKGSQNAYGRSGDDDAGDILIKIIGERSKCTERGRLALTLNKASEIAPQLTKNEFSAITLCFILTAVKQNGIHMLPELASKIVEWCAPLLPDVPQNDSSFAYIASTGCAYINDIASSEFWSMLHATYSGPISNGFTYERYIAALDGKAYLTSLLSVFIRKTESGSMQLFANSVDELRDKLRKTPLSAKEVDQLVDLYAESSVELSSLVDRFSQYKEIVALHNIWQNTRLKHMRLTSIGLAIAHANLRRLVPSFSADLGIWVA